MQPYIATYFPIFFFRYSLYECVHDQHVVRYSSIFSYSRHNDVKRKSKLHTLSNHYCCKYIRIYISSHSLCFMVHSACCRCMHWKLLFASITHVVISDFSLYGRVTFSINLNRIQDLKLNNYTRKKIS